MANVEYRMGLLIAAPLILVFLAGLTAGIVTAFLICNIPLLKRVHDQGRTITFALTAALSLSVLVFLGSVLSGVILQNGYWGQTAYVPEAFPGFLLPHMVEFFILMLVPLVLALTTFGALREASELVQRIVVPMVFLITFIVVLSATKAWESYRVISAQFEAGPFIDTTLQMITAECASILAAFTALADFAIGPDADAGLFGGMFDAIGGRVDFIWDAVKSAGGNQFVLAEAFPEIFAVSSVLALLYMVLRWPFTAFSSAEE
ncbi:hypothetical protein [Breoghania sp. L-A4]|uniref:hypothetical protein n=1 Tax=Breoghania sp. L-A4 TaxID=2304600 RepID=UPI000E358065|nr:hypothetical protein [Breoghania sp. L-A4]AXS39120.1 hypothetical protein D1F64_02410 [Breoghania sp. L-A4]